jgi:WD40 repeat protein
VFERFIETSAFVQGYAVDKDVYLLSDNRVQVFDGDTRQKVAEVELFQKDGLARSFTMDDRYLYCTDFVQLYVLDRASLDVLARLQLGTDLSSDICGVAVDGKGTYLYLGIRNGPLAWVRIGEWENVRYVSLCTSSIWALRCDGDRIYAGNVDGQLLVIDAPSMSVVRQVQAHRQNLKGLWLCGDLVATASQDKVLALWDKGTLEQINIKKNAHKKAFAIVGI